RFPLRLHSQNGNNFRVAYLWQKKDSATSHPGGFPDSIQPAVGMGPAAPKGEMAMYKTVRPGEVRSSGAYMPKSMRKKSSSAKARKSARRPKRARRAVKLISSSWYQSAARSIAISAGMRSES